MPKSPTFMAHPSPNFNERARSIDTILLHYTAGELKQSLDRLCDPNGSNRVSAHYVVDRKGRIYRLVDEKKRAWHAGVSQWKGLSDINSASIGIEIVNIGQLPDGKYDPYTEPQIKAVIALCKDIKTRHKIRNVLGHSDVAVGRKVDPGEHFPWKRLSEAGLGFWTDDLLDPKLSDRAMLETIGYDVSDVRLALTAFQRHFYTEALANIGSCTRARLAAVFKKALGQGN